MGLPFNIESWIWYGINIAIILCRFVARFSHLRTIKKFQIDDYLMMLVVLTETAFMITINKEANSNSNLIQPGVDVSTFTAEDIQERVYGSKLTVVVEQMQCCTVWLLKGCLIALYVRVT
jgi:hypothetical protein